MAKIGIEEIVNAVSDLSVLELSELVKAIEEKFGVSAAAPVAVAGPAAAVEAVEEKTEFDVELTAAGDNKINAIKAVRAIDQSLGLAEAKAKVESAPVVVASGVKKEDADKMKADLEAAGCKVTLK
jgi:large subunit ribosomal protein L7/L12